MFVLFLGNSFYRDHGGGGAGAGDFIPPPTFSMVKNILFYLHHLQKQLTLHINKYINVFSDKPECTTEIMAFQLLFLFSFVLESAVFNENKVSSLNNASVNSSSDPPPPAPSPGNSGAFSQTFHPGDQALDFHPINPGHLTISLQFFDLLSPYNICRFV